jgi:hypothetical protein
VELIAEVGDQTMGRPVGMIDKQAGAVAGLYRFLGDPIRG